MDPATILKLGMTAYQVGSSFFGGDDGVNQTKMVQNQHKSNKRAVKYQNNQIAQQYQYNVTKREIDIQNYLNDRQYKIDKAVSDRDFAMGIRQFQYDRAMREHYRKTEIGTQQLNINGLAADHAHRQQSHYFQQQMLGLAFDEASTMMQYTAAMAGAQIQATGKKAGLEMQRKRAQAGFETDIQGIRQQAQMQNQLASAKLAFGKRDINVQALKAQGQLAARGATGKALQGVEAEAGAAKAQQSKQYFLNMAEVAQTTLLNQKKAVNDLVFTEADININLASIDAQLEFDKLKLDSFLALDKLKLSASRDSLKKADSMARSKINLERLQADLNTHARIGLEPELGPELPEVIIPPVQVFPEVYRPEEIPEPIKGAAYNPVNPYAGVNSAVNVLNNFAQSDTGKGLLNDLFGGGGSSVDSVSSLFNTPINIDYGMDFADVTFADDFGAFNFTDEISGNFDFIDSIGTGSFDLGMNIFN